MRGIWRACVEEIWIYDICMYMRCVTEMKIYKDRRQECYDGGGL